MMPVDGPAVAIAVLPDTHTPPGVVLARVIVPPSHTDSRPVIGVGIGSTLIALVTMQPVPVV